jgi:hypothetical protein
MARKTFKQWEAELWDYVAKTEYDEDWIVSGGHIMKELWHDGYNPQDGADEIVYQFADS